MGNAFGGMIEESLLNLHTAFIAKVISVQSASKCSVQPLDKFKAYGQKAQAHAVITNVPVLSHVRHYETYSQSLSISDTYSGGGSVTPSTHGGHLSVSPIRKGDIVLCVCAERDISSSVKGMSTTPPVGHHQIKDAIVVGLFGG